MIQEFVDRFFLKEKEIRKTLAKEHPETYLALVKMVVGYIADPAGRHGPVDDDYYEPPRLDPNRIHMIDWGDYQGTLLFIIGAEGYQPDRFWAVKVSYGSCSGCDTLQGISGYDTTPPTGEQVDDYYKLALHIVQGLKEIGGADDRPVGL